MWMSVRWTWTLFVVVSFVLAVTVFVKCGTAIATSATNATATGSGHGRDIQTQDTTGLITAVLDKIHKLFGGNLSAFGFALSLPLAVATAIFWGAVFIIVYHIFFVKKGSDFGKFNFFKDGGSDGWSDSDAYGYDFKRKTTTPGQTPIPRPASTLNQLSALVNKAVKRFRAYRG